MILNKKLLRFAGALVVLSCQSVSGVSGTWSGRLGGDSPTSVGMRFELVEQDGKITGTTYVEDTVKRIYYEEASVAGVRNGNDISWTSSTGVEVKGRLDNGKFVGTLTFLPDPDEPEYYKSYDLNRPIVLVR